MTPLRKLLFVAAVCLSPMAAAVTADAAETIRIYTSEGPAPAVRDAVAEFAKRNPNLDLQLQAGPVAQWLPQAREDADLVFSSSAALMTDIVAGMDGRVVDDSIAPLYFRPSAILVRPGNPKKIKGVRDLLKPDVAVMVVHGSGQVGLWEDVVGRIGELKALQSFRRNIAVIAGDSTEAGRTWEQRPEIDAWLIWNVWGIGDRFKSETVPVEKDLRIYRPVEVAMTRRAQQREGAVTFYAFLQSADGRLVFEKWGWTTKAADDTASAAKPASDKPAPDKSAAKP
jgi:accessory colonization factor AcfC